MVSKEFLSETRRKKKHGADSLIPKWDSFFAVEVLARFLQILWVEILIHLKRELRKVLYFEGIQVVWFHNATCMTCYVSILGFHHVKTPPKPQWFAITGPLKFHKCNKRREMKRLFKWFSSKTIQKKLSDIISKYYIYVYIYIYLCLHHFSKVGLLTKTVCLLLSLESTVCP